MIIGGLSDASSVTPDTVLPTLVVMRAGRTRDLLSALLGSFPHIQLLPPSEDTEQVLSQMRTEPPGVVLLDWDLPDSAALSMLRQIRTQYPLARCVMLVSSYQAELLARSAQADAVLFKGFAAHELMSLMCYFRQTQQEPHA